MSEPNLTALDGGKPKIEVRVPTFKHGADFVGILAAGDMAEAMRELQGNGPDSARWQAAFLTVIQTALRSRTSREDLLSLMADLWVYEPSQIVLKADEPPEEWEYDPPLDMVERGQAIGRDERWRSLSMRQRKKLVKKVELEGYPVNLAGEFVGAFKRMPFVEDFLESRKKSEQGEDGSSSMLSPDATGGASAE